MYHRMASPAAQLLHVCFRKRHIREHIRGTFGHIRAHSGTFGQIRRFRVARPTCKNQRFRDRPAGGVAHSPLAPLLFIILKRGHGARCRRQSRQQASRILHHARGRASSARSTASIHRPHGRLGEWQCHILSICSASGWATFRTAMLVAFLSFTYRGPHGATHPNYIRFADATSMPGKEVRASVARPSPPFPSSREAEPPLPSQTRRK